MSLMNNQANGFQSTPPRRRRRQDLIWQMVMNLFNPRLREGGDDASLIGVGEAGSFSIHASAKEATLYIFLIHQQHFFSIHASAKEATKDGTTLNLTNQFSIHASAKEATPSKTYNITSNALFNPRLREGGDVFTEQEARETFIFSIHASAKEAT